jgi:cytochrome P450
VVKVEQYNGEEAWLVTGFAEMKELLQDERVSANSSKPGYPHVNDASAATRGRFPTFLQMDEPEHNHYRRMLNRDFTVKSVQALRPEISEIVDESLDRLLEQEPPVDFFEAFALVVPSTVISRMLGVPESDHEFFQSRTKTLVSGLTTLAEARVATEELSDYFIALIESKVESPGTDLVSRLVVDRMMRGELTRDEVVAISRLLLMGGHDSTANMIALGTLILLLNPVELEQLRSQPELLGNAVEEMIRYFTVTHLGRRRVAVEDICVRDQTIRTGEGIIAATEQANRDPEVFPNPDSFDIDRDTSRHIAFGHGPHQCLGQNLARVEMQVVFSKLFERIPTLRLAVPLDEVAFKEQSIVYGPESLPVTW